MSNENKTALTAEEIKEEFYKCMPFKDVKLTSCDEDADLIVKMEKLSAKQCYDVYLDLIHKTSLQTQEKDKEIERLEKLNVFDVAQLSDKIQSQQKEIEELNNLQQDMCSTIESLQSQLSEVTKERDECISWLTDLMYTSDMDSTQHNKLDKFIKSLTPTKE